MKRRLNGNVIKAYPFITKLYAGYYSQLTNNDLINFKLESLDTNDNKNIYDFNHIKTLKKLSAAGSSGINDKGIQELNLIELYANDNSKIINVNHMVNLQILWAAGGRCGIKDESIKNLKNIIELNVNDNFFINNISHLTIYCYIASYKIYLLALYD